MSGTDEAAQAPSAAEDSQGTQGKVAETLARLRSEAPPAEPTGVASFLSKLEDAGIDATATPKEDVAEVAEPEASPEPEPETPSEVEGLDDLLDTVSSAREKKVNAATSLQEQLEAKGLEPSLAKAMAHHASRKDVEKFLASYGNPLQSETAGQPAPVEAEAPAGASIQSSLAEVQAGLEELTGGEETASAVTGVLSQILDRLNAVEGAAQMSVAAVQTREKAELRDVAQQVTGELQGQYPQLVRDGKTDPAVMQTAAALFDRGHTQGDLAASIRAACQSVYGSPAPPPRQTQNDLTHEPELSAPDDVRDVGTGPIDRRQEQAILTEVFRKNRNKSSEVRAAELAKARKMIDRRNAAARS